MVGHDSTNVGAGGITVTYMGQNAKQYDAFEKQYSTAGYKYEGNGKNREYIKNANTR